MPEGRPSSPAALIMPAKRGRPAHIATRRFTIADGMILVVAAAMGLFLARTQIISRPELAGPREILWAGLQCMLFAFAVGTMALRLRRPRPSLRRVGRQPGFVACAAVLCSAMLDFVNMAAGWMSVSGGAGWRVLGSIFHPTIRSISVTIVARGVILAWAVLGLSAGWRPEPGWIDRLGRGIGMAWLALYFYHIGECILNVIL